MISKKSYFTERSQYDSNCEINKLDNSFECNGEDVDRYIKKVVQGNKEDGKRYYSKQPGV